LLASIKKLNDKIVSNSSRKKLVYNWKFCVFALNLLLFVRAPYLMKDLRVTGASNKSYKVVDFVQSGFIILSHMELANNFRTKYG